MVPVKKDSYLAYYVYFTSVIFFITMCVKIYRIFAPILAISRTFGISSFHLINIETVALMLQLLLGAYLLYSLMKDIYRKKAWFFLLVNIVAGSSFSFSIMGQTVWAYAFYSRSLMDTLLILTSIGLVIVTHRYYKYHA